MDELSPLQRDVVTDAITHYCKFQDFGITAIASTEAEREPSRIRRDAALEALVLLGLAR